MGAAFLFFLGAVELEVGLDFEKRPTNGTIWSIVLERFCIALERTFLLK